LRVDTPQGHVLAEGTHPVGARVVVATRPEHIEINTTVGPDDNRIDGRIRQITFQGSRTRVAVDVGSEADFMVELGGVNELPPQGQAVSLHWPVARSLAFLDAGVGP
jgi:ABC-type Fe3+/spermidine/putrescine transport system ATPase subunit